MPLKGTREASHAFSWYDGDATALDAELQAWLDAVPDTLNNSNLPVPRARVIIAPHAGYSYSGPCAAWAYKTLDLRGIKRVFVLGPSHTYYLSTCALTKFAKYETPYGDLEVDEAVTRALRDTRAFADITTAGDISEHSLEMHMPYLYKRMTQTFGSSSEGQKDSAGKAPLSSSPAFPTIIPILVGNLRSADEKATGELLAPYLRDPENAFVVSSDFCHWGSRFSYTAHVPSLPADGKLEGAAEGKTHEAELGIESLTRRSAAPPKGGAPVHESIRVLDQQAMDAVASGSHDAFVDNLRHTSNTVCGRHPIGVMMAALEVLARDGDAAGAKDEKHLFKFVQYQRSSLVEGYNDSSVSYASAYAVV